MVALAESNGHATLHVAPNLHAVLGSGYVPVPLPVLASGLNPASKLVYAALCHFVQVSEWKGNECAFPSHPQLAATAGVAVSSVERSLKELKKHRLLICKRRGLGLHNDYWLVDQEDWDLPPGPDGTTPLKMRDQEPSKRGDSSPQNEGSGTAKMSDPSPQNEGSHKDKEEGSNQERITKIEQRREMPRARAREGGAAADAAGAASPGSKERKLSTRRTHRPVEGEDTHTPLQVPLPGTDARPRPLKEDAPGSSARGRGTKYPRAVLDEARRATGDEGDWATCEYLVRMRGFTDASWPTYNWWKSALGPLVQTSGREAFSAFVSWLLSDEWCRANAAKIQPAKVAQEFDEWWSKPEPRPAVRQKWSAAKRDDGRVSNDNRNVTYLVDCADCGAELGTPHFEVCSLISAGLVRPASVVLEEHARPDWVVTRLNEQRRTRNVS